MSNDNTYPVSFRLDKKYVRALEKLAKEYNMTRSQVIELILIGKLITSEDLKQAVEQLSKED